MLRTPFHPSDDVSTTEKAFPPSPIKKLPKTKSNKRKPREPTGVYESNLSNLAAAATLDSRTPHNPNYFDDKMLLKMNLQIAHRTEREHGPSVAIFQNNRDITPIMRCKLINWLLEVSLHFRLYRETFYLGIHYLDRFLSLHFGVSKSNLQLIGVACLYIAAKLEEIYPPKLKEFERVCDGSCTRFGIFRTELEVLAAIQWKLNISTVFFWLGSYLELLKSYLHEDIIEPLRSFSLQLIDMAIHTPIFLAYPYSMIAASSLFIRIRQEKLIFNCTGYSVSELKNCVEWLWSLFACPDCIIFYDPNEKITLEDIDYAVKVNSQVMEYLNDQIKMA